MRFSDKAMGSDGLSYKPLIEGAEAPALHSTLLNIHRYIWSIDEKLKERDLREVIRHQSPSVYPLGKYYVCHDHISYLFQSTHIIYFNIKPLFYE